MDRVNPVSFESVEITGGFWKHRQSINRDATMEAVYNRFDETGRVRAFSGDWKEGMPEKPHIFWDSDITKWIEGAATILQKQRDAGIEEKIDILADKMEALQEENGYLNIYFTVVEPEARFTRRVDHELYCGGHLIEAAVAYAKATGKTKLLKIACRFADYVDKVFRIEHSAAFDTPGHQEIELALMKLYSFTGEERYKLLAEYFIETRGTSPRDETYSFADQEHLQSHLPVRRQTEAVGHSVRALYMYTAMADIAKANQDGELYSVCRGLFDNITQKRMYLTGGIGSTHRGESFTIDYDLPEYTAYSETCASIALALFCRRMWLIEADSVYADCAEQAIYNTVLAGVSLRGDSFFYENPLAADPRRNAFNASRPSTLREHLPILERARVFDCSCCPPNLLRFIGSIGDFMYSAGNDTIYAHCYMNGSAILDLDGTPVKLRQETNYPYEGSVLLTTETGGEYTLALRIPYWAENPVIRVCGEEYGWTAQKGYACIRRCWQPGDEILLELPMEPYFVEGNPKSVDLAGKAAICRGPLVYCAEGTDNAFPLWDARISPRQPWQLQSIVLDGVEMPILSGQAETTQETQKLYSVGPLNRSNRPLRLIPYFAWANRGINEMTVWMLSRD